MDGVGVLDAIKANSARMIWSWSWGWAWQQHFSYERSVHIPLNFPSYLSFLELAKVALGMEIQFAKSGASSIQFIEKRKNPEVFIGI